MKYKFTNFIIKGPLAGLHRSPLTYCLLSGLNLATTNVWYSPTYWFSKESSLVILGLRKVNIWSQEISWNLQPFLFFFFFFLFFCSCYLWELATFSNNPSPPSDLVNVRRKMLGQQLLQQFLQQLAHVAKIVNIEIKVLGLCKFITPPLTTCYMSKLW